MQFNFKIFFTPHTLSHTKLVHLIEISYLKMRSRYRYTINFVARHEKIVLHFLYCNFVPGQKFRFAEDDRSRCLYLDLFSYLLIENTGIIVFLRSLCRSIVGWKWNIRERETGSNPISGVEKTTFLQIVGSTLRKFI